MDVRCEKCGTEYELDEARLKPGGVTVKCTNCGHMFKIRKRTMTSTGVPVASTPTVSKPSPQPAASAPVRQDSLLHDDPTKVGSDASPAAERQWLIRLQNGEQKSCRELATLQQWIVAGVVTRESLISRSGKTWKRLGDVAELAQYFDIGDEARTTRDVRPTGKPPLKDPAGAGTLLGIGAAHAPSSPSQDDDIEARTTGTFSVPAAPAPAPPAPSVRTAAPAPAPAAPSVRTAAPPPPPKPTNTPAFGNAATLPSSGPIPRAATAPPPPPPAAAKKTGDLPPVPKGPDGRSTAAWASDPAKAAALAAEDTAGPSGPVGGKLVSSTEPSFTKGDAPAAFSGRVRVGPSDEPSFGTGKIGRFDDDDDQVLPPRRGSRGGLALVLVTLLLGGAAAAAVYMFVLKKDTTNPATTAVDAAIAVTPLVDAATVPPPVVDATEEPTASPLDPARAELPADDEARIRTALTSLASNEAADARALRAILMTQLAQDLTDRAALTADKTEAATLKKEASQLVIDAATLAQKAHKELSDDPAANLAMASVLRLQGKPAKDVKRYTDTAKAKAGTWARDIALAEALVLVRDGKLDEAKTALAAIDTGDGALEASQDVRARFQLAKLAQAQNRTADAKSLAESILSLAPNHAATKSLVSKVDSSVATSDPLPPEEPTENPPSKPDAGVKQPTEPTNSGGGDSYDGYVAKANTQAERNCTKAIELYQKALDIKPNGVEALTGMGYCHIDAKAWSSAFSKFRAALNVSPRYEPALWGVAEMYQQQGRKDDAITAYQKYLEVYPTSAKAKRQLERLGVTGDGDGGGGDPPPTEKPPEQPPEQPPSDPTPTPAPSEGSAS